MSMLTTENLNFFLKKIKTLSKIFKKEFKYLESTAHFEIQFNSENIQLFPLLVKREGEFIEISHKKISPTHILSTLGCLYKLYSGTYREDSTVLIVHTTKCYYSWTRAKQCLFYKPIAVRKPVANRSCYISTRLKGNLFNHWSVQYKRL